jgi:hypothetical protein
MDASEPRRRWPRLVLTLPPETSDALGDLARVHLRDRKREALRLILEGIERESRTVAGAKR